MTAKRALAAVAALLVALTGIGAVAAVSSPALPHTETVTISPGEKIGVSATNASDYLDVSVQPAGMNDTEMINETVGPNGSISVDPAPIGAVWHNPSPLPGPKVGAGAATINDTTYVWGGSSPATYSRPADGGNWTVESQIPYSGGSGQGTAVANGSLWALGGYDDSYSAKMYRYDPDTGNWTQEPNLPEGWNSVNAVGYENALFVFGGYDGSSVNKSVLKYDIESKSWSIVGEMDTRYSSAAYAATDDGIAIIGGNGRKNVSYFRPGESDKWASGPQLPQTRSNAGAAEIDGQLIVAGGGWDLGSRAQVLRLSGSEWTNVSKLPRPRENPAVAVSDGNLSVLGGDISGGGSTATTRFEPMPDASRYRVSVGPSSESVEALNISVVGSSNGLIGVVDDTVPSIPGVPDAAGYAVIIVAVVGVGALGLKRT
jgi:hypothetical protein